jgi:hypothetical protein
MGWFIIVSRQRDGAAPAPNSTADGPRLGNEQLIFIPIFPLEVMRKAQPMRHFD